MKRDFDLVTKMKDAGVHTINFSAIGGYAFGGNAYALPSGIYIYMIEQTVFFNPEK